MEGLDTENSSKHINGQLRPSAILADKFEINTLLRQNLAKNLLPPNGKLEFQSSHLAIR